MSRDIVKVRRQFGIVGYRRPPLHRMELLTMRDLITWVRVTRLYMRRGECGAQTVRARQPFTTQEAT